MESPLAGGDFDLPPFWGVAGSMAGKAMVRSL